MVNHLHASTKLISESRAIAQFGRSRSFFKRARKSGRLLSGVWIRVNNRILYNEALLMDWFVNQADPNAHEEAIRAFLNTLPSNQRGKSGRKAKTSITVIEAKGGQG